MHVTDRMTTRRGLIRRRVRLRHGSGFVVLAAGVLPALSLPVRGSPTRGPGRPGRWCTAGRCSPFDVLALSVVVGSTYRTFLRLSQRAAPGAPGTARERDAQENYLRLRDHLSPLSRSADPEEAALGLRSATRKWHQACGDLAAADGTAAEYVGLRLGRPIEYEESRRLLASGGPPSAVRRPLAHGTDPSREHT